MSNNCYHINMNFCFVCTFGTAHTTYNRKISPFSANFQLFCFVFIMFERPTMYMHGTEKNQNFFDSFDVFIFQTVFYYDLCSAVFFIHSMYRVFSAWFMLCTSKTTRKIASRDNFLQFALYWINVGNMIKKIFLFFCSVLNFIYNKSNFLWKTFFLQQSKSQVSRHFPFKTFSWAK